jgi:hypothetical protein
MTSEPEATEPAPAEPGTGEPERGGPEEGDPGAPRGGRPDSRLTLALSAAGAVAIGAAIQVREGYGAPAAFVLLTVGVVAVLLAVVLPTQGWIEAGLRRVLPTLLVAALVEQLHALVRVPPARPFALVPGWQPTFVLAAVAAAVAAFAVAWTRGGLRRAGLVALLGIHLVLGIWTIRVQATPRPPIDVFLFQRDAVAALLGGVDPYSITFANPYGSGAYYGPGMVADGRLLFGFVYPPLSLYASTLGQWVGGDVRYAQLLAMTLAAALMATTRRGGPVGGLAAGLYLFTPRNLFVLEQSWTEPFVVLFLAATVWCAARHPRLAPWALGLFLGIKQYVVLALPLALLLARPPMTLAGFRAVVVRAVLVAAAVTLPLALLDVPGFVRAVVTLQFVQPFRPEALSYLGLLAGRVPAGAPPPPAPFGPGVAFAAALVVAALALWRVARTPAGFALGVSAVFLAFFVLNKQAFANYYFFVVGALCVTVAAADPRTPRTDPGERDGAPAGGGTDGRAGRRRGRRPDR